jgi:hypothetical protein
MPPKKRAVAKKKAEVTEDSGLESTPPAEEVKETKKKTVKAKAKKEELSPEEETKPASPKVASPKPVSAPAVHASTHANAHATNTHNADTASVGAIAEKAIITSEMTEEEKKAARAARFGIPFKTATTKEIKTATAPSTKVKPAVAVRPYISFNINSLTQKH